MHRQTGLFKDKAEDVTEGLKEGALTGSMTYIRPNNAALSPPKVLWHAKYALIASFLLDTDSVFAAAICVIDGSFWAEMIQPHIR